MRRAFVMLLYVVYGVWVKPSKAPPADRYPGQFDDSKKISRACRAKKLREKINFALSRDSTAAVELRYEPSRSQYSPDTPVAPGGVRGKSGWSRL